METQRHRLRVDEKLVRVGLLFLDLEHLFLAQASLLGLEALLGSAGVLLAFLVFLLLKLVFLRLVRHADWDRLEVSLESFGNLFDRHILVL